jgi:hypothetical protein
MISNVKRLKFFPDDRADPLWDADKPGFMVNLDSLPLREREGRELFERIKSELGPDWSVEWELQLPV